MVKPARGFPLPKQEGRKNEQLQGALETLRRDQNAKPLPLRLVWSRPADSAASDTSTDAVWVSTREVRLVRVALLAETTAAASSSNYATLKLQAYDAAGDQTTRQMASMATDQRALTAFEPRGFDLDRVQLPLGWVLRLIVTKTGSGVQLGRIHVCIEGEELR